MSQLSSLGQAHVSMPVQVSLPTETESRAATRLLRQATFAANPSKLLYLVKAKLQPPQKDIITQTLIQYVQTVAEPSLGVFQVLFEMLGVHANGDELQHDRSQISLIAAREGRVEILSHLIYAGLDVNDNHGAILQSAVLAGHIACVQLLLEQRPSADTIHLALLSTDFLEIGLCRAMVEVLMKANWHSAVLEYVVLKMYTGSPGDKDGQIHDCLVKAMRDVGEEAQTDEESRLSTLTAYFACQKRARTSIFSPSILALRRAESTTSHEMSDVPRPKRNIFGDEVLQTPNDLIIRLLDRFIKNHAYKEPDTGGSHLRETVNRLLQMMPRSFEELSGYHQCVSLAASIGQTELFAMLLAQRALPKRGLLSLPYRTIIENTRLMDVLFNHLTQHRYNYMEYREVAERLLEAASAIQLLPQIIYLCSRSRVILPFSSIKESLKHIISRGQGSDDIPKLIDSMKVERCDIDDLWTFMCSLDMFPTRSVCALLRTGYDSPDVAKTLLRCTRLDFDSTQLSDMIESWQISKANFLQDEFDYRAWQFVPLRRSIPPMDHAGEFRYFATLASALSLAIHRQNPRNCRMLLEKGAPLVSRNRSLIQEATICGPIASSLEEDEILSLTIEYGKRRADSQDVLNFALLSAVHCGRLKIIADLISLGASTAAYGNKCWMVAIDQSSQALFDCLLSKPKERLILTANFAEIFAGFAEGVHDKEKWIILLGKLHQAGFVNGARYAWVLLSLCQHGELDAPLAEQLISYGVSDGKEFGQFLERYWLYGELELFGTLFDRTAAESLSRTIEKVIEASAFTLAPDYLAFLDHEKSPRISGARNFILSLDMPQSLISNVLIKVATLSEAQNPSMVQILKPLLQKGGQFASEDSLALLNCLLVGDAELTSLVNASAPSRAARTEAFHHLFQFPDATELDPQRRADALVQLLLPTVPVEPRIIVSHPTVMDITTKFLSPEAEIPTVVIHAFYAALQVRGRYGFCTVENRRRLEKILEDALESFDLTKDGSATFLRNVSAVLYWVQPQPTLSKAQCWFTPGVYRHLAAMVTKDLKIQHSSKARDPDMDAVWLAPDALDRFLIIAARKGLKTIAEVLIQIGVDANAVDANGRSALLLAVSASHYGVVELLVQAGANPNDGSLHEAACLQSHEIMKLLLRSGHDHRSISHLHDGAIPVQAFVGYPHPELAVAAFGKTFEILFKSYPRTEEGYNDLRSAVECALSATLAFELMTALVPCLKLFFDEGFLGPRPLFPKDAYTYSLLSLVELWTPSRLSSEKRSSIASSLRECGFEETFYITEGDQPGNAVNVPEHLIQAEDERKRRQAFETKDCCVHGDQADGEEQVHAGLAPACAAAHGWKDEIICSDCLKMFLETRMFPHDNRSTKYKFPAMRIPCWAPNCPVTDLPHYIIRKYTSADTFRTYDNALCRSLLRESNTILKCATAGCAGAYWCSVESREKLKIFFCHFCSANTCLECNDLYEKHDNHPCPAGEEARKSERLKEEERLSEEALKKEKRCPNPKCRLLYYKYTGCDHITCGKNVYDNTVDSKLPLLFSALLSFCNSFVLPLMALFG